MTEYKYTYENGTLQIEFEGSTDREDWRENFSSMIKSDINGGREIWQPNRNQGVI